MVSKMSPGIHERAAKNLSRIISGVAKGPHVFCELERLLSVAAEEVRNTR